jgi:hypothetical protein
MTADNEKKVRAIHDTKKLDAAVAGIKQTQQAVEVKKEADAEVKPKFRFRATRAARAKQAAARSEESIASSSPSDIGMTTQAQGYASVDGGIKKAKATASAGSDGPTLKPVPDTCFDGEQDGNELGVDCGGDCSRRCGMMTTFIKHDASAYHHITIVPRQTDIAGEAQMQHEQQTPKIISNMPKDEIERAKATAEQHAAASEQTQFEAGEDGSDRLVEGEWKKVSDGSASTTALLESNQRRRKLRR